ncbi:MAG TPA: ATP-binding protein [Candidatus Didemnitutus sp.]|nr:ATP-binding protein [Candidatus Didemnitutus sp.]
MSSPFQSIRWRVQIWHGVILFIALAAFCVTACRLAWNDKLHEADGAIWSREWAVLSSILRSRRATPDNDTRNHESPPFSAVLLAGRLRAGDPTVTPEVAAQFSGHEPGYSYFSFRDTDGRVLLQSANVPADLQFLPATGHTYAEQWRSIGDRREVARNSTAGIRSIVGHDLTPELATMHQFAWALGACALAVWLLGLVGGWWLAGRAIRPINIISRTADRIANGDLGERIQVAGTDSELDQLSRVLNQTFARLHDSIEHQKQFTADASHELRTPVTILLSETGRLLRNNRVRTEQEYRDVLQTCNHAANRMRRLVEALLVLARQESEAARAIRDDCDLADIVREITIQLNPLAAARDIVIETDLAAAPCRGDPVALAVMAGNLVANAIEHNATGRTVAVSCSTESGEVIFSVRDDGPGIAAADLPHIFRRFYRADKARSSSTGHAGLGLAIALAVARNHGGSIVASSPPDGGAVFTVRLPAANTTLAAAVVV